MNPIFKEILEGIDTLKGKIDILIDLENGRDEIVDEANRLINNDKAND